MSLITLAGDTQIKKIQQELQPHCERFSKLNDGAKIAASDRLFMENQLLKKLGVGAVEVIEDLDEKLELSEKKNVLYVKKLKESKNYDKEELEAALNLDPVITKPGYNRARKHLEKLLNKKQ